MSNVYVLASHLPRNVELLQNFMDIPSRRAVALLTMSLLSMVI